MENIKKQINGIVKYESSDLESLKKEYQELSLRINDGLAKMKAAAVFTEAEITKIGEYAKQLLITKFDNAKQTIVDSIRESFEF